MAFHGLVLVWGLAYCASIKHLHAVLHRRPWQRLMFDRWWFIWVYNSVKSLSSDSAIMNNNLIPEQRTQFTSFSLCNESFSLDEELVDLVWGFGGLMSRSPFRGWPCQSNVCAFMSSSVWLNYSVVCIHSLISRLLKECPSAGCKLVVIMGSLEIPGNLKMTFARSGKVIALDTILEVMIWSFQIKNVTFNKKKSLEFIGETLLGV